MTNVRPLGADEAGMPVEIAINDVALTLDASGAVWWPGEQALLVADLHLEKGSSFARSGQLLPPYDTMATLQRLAAVADARAARRIILLGDAFHDPYAGERIATDALAAIAALGRGRDLVWISGNHDPAPPADVAGERLDELRCGGLILRHLPGRKTEAGEIAGHLHPVARVKTRAAVVRRACFLSDARRMILPAFGAYTGGLNVRDAAFDGLFSAPRVHVLGARRVLPMGLDRLV